MAPSQCDGGMAVSALDDESDSNASFVLSQIFLDNRSDNESASDLESDKEESNDKSNSDNNNLHNKG